MDGVLTAGQVAQYIKEVLESDVLLCNVWVTGEVSNLSHSPQGHTFFTLKDQDGQLRCVLFRQAGQRQAALLRQGVGALVHGRISLYEAQGTCQLYVDLIQPEGVGLLHRRLEELKARLMAEGLFAAERKRPLPTYPRKIGVVTSAQAAALQDILRVLSERFPAVDVVLAPSLVQGDQAAPQLVAAIETLNARGDIDVIILARGGGSIEELWPFNEEEVARAIAGSFIPIISGIGHETDVTIADLAADVRAATPSAAAMIAVPDGRDVLDRVRTLGADLRELMFGFLDEQRHAVAGLERQLALVSPRDEIRHSRARVSELAGATARTMTSTLTLRHAQVHGLTNALAALNPAAHFERGYAVVTDATTGMIISTLASTSPGQRLRIRVRDGTFDATVTASHEA